MKNSIIKKIVSFVLVFLLIISFTIGILLSIMKFTVFDKQYIISVIKENNYYSKTYNNIIEKFKDNTIQAGLEENVLEGIITEKQIEEDTIIMIDNIYENAETKVNTEIVKIRLKEKIDKIIADNKKRVSSEEQEAINIYIDTIENIYKDGILYRQDYIDSARGIMSRIINISSIIMCLSYAVTLILLVIVIIISKRESISYISSTLISTGILLCVPKIIEEIQINTHNILLFNINFSSIVVNIIEGMFKNLVVCGTVCICIGLFINVFNLKNKNLEKEIKE